MDLIDHLQGLSARIDKQLAYINTEEATKTALVLPFINALGYNVFDPTEVVPEFTCDVSLTGLKKGERVDYALKRDDEVLMLIEVKPVGGNLDVEHASQLLRYFHATSARVGVLTNGVVYRFFSDLEEPNKMDRRPFLEFDLRDVQEPVVAELKKLSRAHFDVGALVEGARELKMLRELRKAVGQEIEEPSEEFLRLLAARVGVPRFTAGVREQLAPLVKRALRQYVNDRLNARLQTAIEAEGGIISNGAAAPDLVPTETAKEAEERQREIETTAEEMEAFHIVRALLRPYVDVSRVHSRDVQTYFGILLDNNNRKPICRLHFNWGKKYVEVFDTEAGEKVAISSLDDIYGLADRLRAAVERFAKPVA